MARNAYMGADEVQALVGAWQQIIGADVNLGPTPGRGSYRTAPPVASPYYAPPQPYYPPPQYQAPYQAPYVAPYATPTYGASPYATPTAPAYWRNRSGTLYRRDRRGTFYRDARGLWRPVSGVAATAAARPFGGLVRDHRVSGLPWWGVPAGAAALLAYGAKHPSPRAALGAWQTIIGADGDTEGLPFPPRNALVDAPGPTQADREVLPMSTGVAILPTQSAQITARPQRVAFRPERVFISAAGTSGGAADWIVNDIKIGNRSQFSQSGDVPGDMFASTAIDGFVSFETAQTAMDVVMVVTYIGTNESGAAFYASIVGTAAL